MVNKPQPKGVAPKRKKSPAARGKVFFKVDQRLTDRRRPPDEKIVAAWLGAKSFRRWQQLIRDIEETYPGIFAAQWLFGGAKHGWTLRYKKSKSFCTLIPERRRFWVQVVFGAAEREAAERLLPSLTPRLRRDYAKAPALSDGRWMVSLIDGDAVLRDLLKLLAVKRRPR